MRRMILPLLLLAAVGCQPPEQQATATGPDVEAITAAFERAVAAASAGDIEGILAFYADDAVSMPPNEPPRSGKAAIRSAMEADFAENTFQLTAGSDEAVVAGDLAMLRTLWEETVTPKGGGEPAELSGVWLIVLKKQTDGSWKAWREMWSVIAPPPPPAM